MPDRAAKDVAGRIEEAKSGKAVHGLMIAPVHNPRGLAPPTSMSLRDDASAQASCSLPS